MTNLSKSVPLNRCLVTISILCLTLTLAACSIQHISVLRDAQNDFSAAARLENEATGEVLFPTYGYLNNLASQKVARSQALSLRLNVAELTDLHLRYSAVHGHITALLKESKANLKKDGLYCAAAALKTQAQARAIFYKHTLYLGTEKADEGQTPPRLTEVTEEAEEVLGICKDALSPRDHFALEAMEPMILYHISVIGILKKQTSDQGELNTPKPEIQKIIEKIVAAEKTLDEIKAEAYRHLEGYKFLSRYSMLRTARSLAIQVQKLNTDAAAAKFKALKVRIDKLNRDYVDNALYKMLAPDPSLRNEPLLAPVGRKVPN